MRDRCRGPARSPAAVEPRLWEIEEGVERGIDQRAGDVGAALRDFLQPWRSARIRAGMPGSGPIDPTIIWNAIHNGATYANGLLNGQHLAISPLNAWLLSSSGTYTLTQNGYDKLSAGTVSNGYIVAGGVRYKLAPVGSTADAVLA